VAEQTRSSACQVLILCGNSRLQAGQSVSAEYPPQMVCCELIVVAAVLRVAEPLRRFLPDSFAVLRLAQQLKRAGGLPASLALLAAENPLLHHPSRLEQKARTTARCSMSLALATSTTATGAQLTP